MSKKDVVTPFYLDSVSTSPFKTHAGHFYVIRVFKINQVVISTPKRNALIFTVPIDSEASDHDVAGSGLTSDHGNTAGPTCLGNKFYFSG